MHHCIKPNYNTVYSFHFSQASHLLPSVFGHLPLVIDITLVAKHHLLNIC